MLLIHLDDDEAQQLWLKFEFGLLIPHIQYKVIAMRISSSSLKKQKHLYSLKRNNNKFDRNKIPDSFFFSFVMQRIYFYPKTGFYFCTCEDGAGWHLIPCRISPRSEFFSQAYKNWHIMWGINLGIDWPPLARGSKFHTIHTPTRSLSFLP